MINSIKFIPTIPRVTDEKFVIKPKNTSNNPQRHFVDPQCCIQKIVDPQNFESRTCVSTKCVESFLKILWIHNPGNRKIVDPQNFTSKFCGSTKMQKIEKSQRSCIWTGKIGHAVALAIFYVAWLDFTESARLQKNPPLRRFSCFFDTKKSIDLKKTFLFLNRLRSQTCFNCTGIDQ